MTIANFRRYRLPGFKKKFLNAQAGTQNFIVRSVERLFVQCPRYRRIINF